MTVPEPPLPLERYLAADVAYTRYNARRALRLADHALETRPAGRATATRDLTSDSAYYNRIVGLGEGDLPYLDEAIAWYHDAGTPCGVTLTPQRATGSLLGALARRGFQVEGGDTVLTVPCHAVREPDAPFSIRRATEQDLDAVFDLWAGRGDPISAEVRTLRRPEHLAPELAIFLATVDETPVAMATTFFAHGLAWLGNANTAPAYRGRGCQRALIAHRLWHAAQTGAGWAVTDTQFGTVSHRNALRAGMHTEFLTRELGLMPSQAPPVPDRWPPDASCV